jgi:hypothetical protein
VRPPCVSSAPPAPGRKRHREPSRSSRSTPPRSRRRLRARGRRGRPSGRRPGQRPRGLRSAYLDIARVVRSSSEAGCDAVWPGWGFVSERPDFADACADGGPRLHRPLGRVDAPARRQDRRQARGRAARRPGHPWSGGPVVDADEATRHAERIGYPVLLKAAAGGGGRGIRIVRAAEELAAAFASAAHEARAAFGDPTLLVEAFAPRRATSRCRSSPTRTAASTPSAPAIAACSAATRRCSRRPPRRASAPWTSRCKRRRRGRGPRQRIRQRRHRRVPRAARPLGLLLPGDEHPAPGGAPRHRVRDGPRPRRPADRRRPRRAPPRRPAPRPRPRHRGSAQRRGPRRGLPPQRGRSALRARHRPRGARRLRLRRRRRRARRVRLHARQGHRRGAHPRDALARLEEALARSTVAIEGGASNRSCCWSCRPRRLPRGPVTTRWLDRHLAASRRPPGPPAPRRRPGRRRHRRVRSAPAPTTSPTCCGTPTAACPRTCPQPEPRSFRFSVGGESVSLEVLATGPDRYRVSCGDSRSEVTYHATGRAPRCSPCAAGAPGGAGGHPHGAPRRGRQRGPPPRARLRRPRGGARARGGDAGVRARGRRVAEGDRLMTLEVMKMEIAIEAPVAGRIGRLLVRSRRGHRGAVPRRHRGRAPSAGPPWRASPRCAPTFRRRARRRDAAATPRSAVIAGLRPPRPRGRRLAGPAARRQGARGPRRARAPARRLRLPRAPLRDRPRPGRHGPGRPPRPLPPPQARRRQGLPEAFVAQPARRAPWHDVRDADAAARHDDALLRILQAHGALGLRDRDPDGRAHGGGAGRPRRRDAAERTTLRERLEAFAAMVVRRDRALSEAAYTVLYHLCDRPRQRAEARTLSRAAARPSPASSPRRPPRPRAAVEAELDALPHGRPALAGAPWPRRSPAAPSRDAARPAGASAAPGRRRARGDLPADAATAALYARPAPRCSRCCRARSEMDADAAWRSTCCPTRPLARSTPSWPSPTRRG